MLCNQEASNGATIKSTDQLKRPVCLTKWGSNWEMPNSDTFVHTIMKSSMEQDSSSFERSQGVAYDPAKFSSKI